MLARLAKRGSLLQRGAPTRRASEKVGSNYFLFDRRLRGELNFPFAALASDAGVASAAPNQSAISKIVNHVCLPSNSMIDKFIKSITDLVNFSQGINVSYINLALK